MSQETWSLAPPVTWRNAKAVSPSDSLALTDGSGNPIVTLGIWVGTAGDITVDVAGAGGTNITFKSVPVGFLPIAAVKVYSTLTSATNMVAVWG